MPTYFGYNVDETTYHTYRITAARNKAGLPGFTCPGSGAKGVRELAARGYATAGSNIRSALYNTSSGFIAQGSAQIALPLAVTWNTHTSFTNVAGMPISPTIVGGLDYLLVASVDSGAPVNKLAYTVSVLGDCVYGTIDYTGGYPDPLGILATQVAEKYCLRCGVVSIYNLSSDTGVFSESGKAAGLIASRKFIASKGSYNETGISSNFIISRNLNAEVGSCNLYGNKVGLSAKYLHIDYLMKVFSEDRIVGVQLDDRLVKVLSNDRLAIIQAEDRLIRVPSENRILGV